ncbi:MAG: Ig-like domain-containing protein [Lachnoclostridium sp.]
MQPKAANSNAAIEAAVQNLHRAISALEYKEEYSNPFAAIDAVAPSTRIIMKTGTSEQLFTLPDSVKDNVTVEYFSSDEKSATYADGKVTALKEGKVTVTAIVTAKATKVIRKNILLHWKLPTMCMKQQKQLTDH